MMEKWEDFLKKTAVEYGLTTTERDIFLRQFCAANRGKQKAKTEEEFAAELKVELPSYKKHKTEIFKKLTKSDKNPQGCEFGRGAGKLAELETFLVEKYESWIAGKDTIVPPREDLGCPYKGLFAFKPEDAEFFFGRERFTNKLIDLIQSQPFLAVIGNSGIGKSSIVYAGVIPELVKLGNWRCITFRPKDAPFAQLSNAVLSFLEPKMDKFERLTKAKKYVANFKTGELTIKDILDDSLSEKSNQHLLIFIDQFEELWILTPPEEREIFISQLLEVVQAEKKKGKRSPDIVVVITLRVDFHGQAMAYQPLGEILQEWKPEPILPMNREELQEAIEKPAAVVGLTIQEGLTKIILDEVKNNPGELPLLEFALEKLWEKRNNGQLTIAAYQEIEGVEKALANHGEEIYQKLNADEQNRFRYIFTQLVRFGESTEATRRLATEGEIGAENWNLVAKLAGSERELEARLVITGYDESKQQRTVEVVHEALIRGWERLREWMEDDREFRKWQDRLRAEKDTWENNDRDNGVLLRGALLVQAEEWLEKRNKSITNQAEREFILASRRFQEQEDIARIQELLILSQKELELKQHLSALVIAVKAGVKLGNIREPSVELKRSVIERLQQGSYGISEQNQLLGHEGEINDVVFSPDGSKIASASDDSTIKLWDLEGNLLHTCKQDIGVLRFSLSPDGQIIASSNQDGTIKLWSIDGMLLKTFIAHDAWALGISFSPDGQMIASGSADKTIKLWSIDGALLKTFSSANKNIKLWSVDGTLLKTFIGHDDQVQDVSFSPDGQMIASASADKTIKLWSIDGTLLKSFIGHEALVHKISFSPDGQKIASASFDKTIKLWSIDGTLLKTFLGHDDLIRGVSFSPDGQIIASASDDRTVRLWNLEGTLLRTLTGHRERIFQASFSPNGQRLASCGFDKTLRLWRIDKMFVKTFTGHEERVRGVSFSPDGERIASASYDKTIKLWSMDGTLLKTFMGHDDHVQDVSFSPDGQIIASASYDKTIKLWSMDGTLLKTFIGHGDIVWKVSFSPDGQMIASASYDKTIKLWSIDGTLLQTFIGHEAQVQHVIFSPDGQMIASASYDKTIKLWSVDGTLLKTIVGHDERVHSVSFSPDGQTIVSGGMDTLRLWNLDGTLLRTFIGHNDWIYEVSFSPDGQIIASSSTDKTIKLWNLEGTLLRTLVGHEDWVVGLSFSPDGQRIASGGHDKTIKLWNLDTKEDAIVDLDIKLNNLLKKGCNWIKDYLKTNPNVTESDRHLCDDICDGSIDPRST